jgi:uncharacterized protein
MKRLLDEIRQGDLAGVKALLEAGAPLMRSAWRRLWLRYEPTPLQAAVETRNVAITESLLDHGADPNDGTSTRLLPLSEACYRAELRMIDLLVSRGAEVNPNGDVASPLDVAATNGRENVVVWLLEHGANPSAVFAPRVAVHRVSQAILARVIDAGGKAPPEIEKVVRAGKW